MMFVGILFALVFPKQVAGYSSIKDESAYLTRQEGHVQPFTRHDQRIDIVQRYLETYDSPLAPYAKTFIETADQHNLDWKLVTAIAGVESYFGHMIPPYSNNAWGYHVYGNNTRGFASWEEGIQIVSEAIRTDYLGNLPHTNVYVIGAKYAADPLWASKVTRFMGEIERYSTKTSKPSLPITL